MSKVDEFVELVKGKARPEGSISPNGKYVKRGGKWVPKKKEQTKRKKKAPSKRRQKRPEDPLISYYQSLPAIAEESFEKQNGFHDIDNWGAFEKDKVATSLQLGHKVSSGDEFTAHEQKSIEFLNGMMEPLKTTERVFRGLSVSRDDTKTLNLFSNAEGSKIPLSVPTSTSMDGKYSIDNFTGIGGDDIAVFFDLTLPKGTPCFLYNSTEREVALSSGMSIDIKRSSKFSLMGEDDLIVLHGVVNSDDRKS